MPDRVRVLQTEEEIKIFAHPYRNRIVKAYSESPVPLTVTQAANIMGEVPANVHYHLKKLLKIEVLELDHIKVIKGINAKYYRLSNESYRLSTPIHGDDDEKPNKQMDQIKNLLYSELDDFKTDIEKVQRFDPTSKTPKGIFWKRDIYLSDEDIKELGDYAEKFMNQKMIKDDTKQRYSSLISIFIKD